MIQRIRESCAIHMIDRDVFLHFLSVIRPRFMGDRCFVFRFRGEPMRCFWAEGRHYFCRQLTQEEATHLEKILSAGYPPPATV